jgi:hypothetical protein
MSYIYSRALVEEYSEANCSDIDASALLNESHTPKPSWWHDKTMEPSRHSRFGMTYAPLTESLGEELLTWFVGGSLAKTSASQETGPDWTASGQGYGQKWRGLLAKYNPATHSLKTAQLSLLEDLTECCATLPRWGFMLDGELYPQPMLELCTSEKGYGYWPTPTVCGNYNRKGASATSGDGLATAVKMYPTPTRRDYRSEKCSQEFKDSMDAHPRGKTLPWVLGGLLNPDWTEWLMGWPIGQTALKPLETGRLAEWQQQHSHC